MIVQEVTLRIERLAKPQTVPVTNDELLLKSLRRQTDERGGAKQIIFGKVHKTADITAPGASGLAFEAQLIGRLLTLHASE